MTTDRDAGNKVLVFPAEQGRTTPQMVLIDAEAADLATIMVIGYLSDGSLYVRSSGDVTRMEALWLIEQAKLNALGMLPECGGDE